jgi:hypothetical protein
MFASFVMKLRFFLQKKVTKTKKEKKGGLLALSYFTWHWHNRVKTHQLVCLDIQTPQLLKGGIDQWDVWSQ